MAHPLRGKRIWIIGAGQGIGAALAAELANIGAMTCLSARSVDHLQEVLAGLAGVGHLSLPLDVTDPASITDAFSRLHAAWPRIDVIIFNAGIYMPLTAENFNMPDTKAMIDTNLTGAFLLLDALLPLFRQQRGGHLALVGSIAGFRGLPGTIGYGATKAAIISLAETLRLELSPQVKVQIINPGFVDTQLMNRSKHAKPFQLTPEQAARHIMQGLASNAFEIHFPKALTLPLKLTGHLPYAIYFPLIRLVSAALRKF